MAKTTKKECALIPTYFAQNETKDRFYAGNKQRKGEQIEYLKAKHPLISGHKVIHTKMKLWHHTNKSIIGELNGQPICTTTDRYMLQNSQ